MVINERPYWFELRASLSATQLEEWGRKTANIFPIYNCPVSVILRPLPPQIPVLTSLEPNVVFCC